MDGTVHVQTGACGLWVTTDQIEIPCALFKDFVPDCTLQTYNCNVLCLTNKRRSHNDSVLVVGQLGYAVGIARRLQVKNILDLLAFVAHRFGSYTQETDTI